MENPKIILEKVFGVLLPKLSGNDLAAIEQLISTKQESRAMKTETIKQILKIVAPKLDEADLAALEKVLSDEGGGALEEVLAARAGELPTIGANDSMMQSLTESLAKRYPGAAAIGLHGLG